MDGPHLPLYFEQIGKTWVAKTQMMSTATTLFLLFHRSGFLHPTDPESGTHVT